jgi:DNA polymerase III alpha subunit (gram-positive type)
MIVVGLDLETTGLDKVNDRPIEIGLALWTTKYNRALESRSVLVKFEGVKVTDEITEVTGINQSMVDVFGVEPETAFEEAIYFVDAEQVEAIVAFNGRRFDIPVMHQWAKRIGGTFPDKFIIDPYEDMPATLAGPTPGMRPQELITMCAKEGIYYDPHEAGADVGAMLRLMSKRNFEHVLQRAKSPVVVVRSMQDRNNNAAAKKHKFRWNPERKIWWKAVKEIDLHGLAGAVNNEFGLEVLDLQPEDLEDQ